MDTHPRDLRRNIWNGIMRASPQEIIEGMSFYEGANGLCRMFASIYNLTSAHIAGIYAALSPLNTWDTNVSNILDILRHRGSNNLPSVNTTNSNRDKAVRIASGENPEFVLRGKKVISFYRAISNPLDQSPIPVDRHLFCLATNSKITNNIKLRNAMSDNTLYDRIELAYIDLGKREGIGNRLAAIAWFYQRRSNGTLPILHPSRWVCCNSAMTFHGKNRFKCVVCGKTRTRNIAFTKYPLPSRILTNEGNVRGILPLFSNPEGRIWIYLGKGAKYAASNGCQYLARYEMMKASGELLHKDEHVHHSNGHLWDCRTDNLEVWLSERHGRWHATKQLLYMGRDLKGRFTPSSVPAYHEQCAS